MFDKFFISDDDIPMCSVTKNDRTTFFAMSDSVPVPINPVYTLPGKAGRISKEEFLKIANPEALKFFAAFDIVPEK